MAQDVNKIITLPLLTAYDVKIKELIGQKDSALKTELLEEIGKITSFEVKIVDELPALGESGYIYFVPKKDGYSSSEQNVYEEYLWIEKSAAGLIWKTEIPNDKKTYKTQELAQAAIDAYKVDHPSFAGIAFSEDVEAVYAFEKIGDTKIDLDTLKSDIADDVAGAYVKSVDVSSSESTVGAITTTTYTISYKNGNGEEVDSESISVISNVGKVVADGEDVTGYDGLMSKEDKAILDTLNADMSSFQKIADADSKYVTSFESQTPAIVDNGDGSKTVTTTYKTFASDGTELTSFDVVGTTYVNAQSAVEADPDSDVEGKAAVGGLLSAEDKVKLDNMSGNADAKYVASLDITAGEGVVTGSTVVSTVTVSAKNANGEEIDSDTFDVTTYNVVSQEANGLMSLEDKTKLDLMTYATEEEILALFPTETTS